MSRRLLGGIVVPLVFMLAGPSAATATTFGASLNRQPDGTHTCGDFGFASCTWTSIDLTTGESGLPPTGVGVVSQVAVRVGPVTGPMQIVELEGLYRYAPIDPIGQARLETPPASRLFSSAFVCCTAVAVSRPFTPQVDGVTTIPVNMPVRQDAAPDPASGSAVSDFLALSVLAPNVPIPASSEAGDTTSDGGWFPAWDHPGQQRHGGPYATSGAIILFAGDWHRALPVALASPTARVSGDNDATLRVACNLAAGCQGLASLQNHAGTKNYGSARYSIRGAKQGTIGVHLNRAGRRLLERRHGVTVWADFQVKDASAYPDRAQVRLSRSSP